MKQEVISGDIAREKLFKGAEKLALAVIASLGVNGRRANYVYQRWGNNC